MTGNVVINFRKQELAKLDELIKARFVEMFGDESNPFQWPVMSEEYHLSNASSSATGVVTSEGFVVYKGATISSTATKSLGVGATRLRDQLITEGKVKNWITTEDILFSSSSTAASFVFGYSASGPQNWKAQDGRTLKEIEESKTASV